MSVDLPGSVVPQLSCKLPRSVRVDDSRSRRCWLIGRPAIALAVVILMPVQVLAQGELLRRTLSSDGMQRQYLLYVPSSYDSSRETALVLNFHGFSQGAQAQVQTSMMNLVAEEESFLVAYPQGTTLYNPQLRMSGAGWNLDGTLANHDDVEFTRRLIDHIGADYSVDPSRVHATGYSFGAMMTFTLACLLADRIASIAPVAGNIWHSAYQNCTTDRPVSVMLFHGTDDASLHEGDAFTASAAASASYWAHHDNCDRDSVASDLPDLDPNDHSTVRRIEYVGCDSGSQVIFYKIIHGGHTWPGGTRSTVLYGNLNRDVAASSEMWTFFSANPMVSVGTHNVQIPSDHLLIRAYPNPFSTSTTISYNLPQAENVRLSIIDIVGKEVRILDYGLKLAGLHDVLLSAVGLPSGLYVYRLKAGDQVEAGSLVLAK